MGREWYKGGRSSTKRAAGGGGAGDGGGGLKGSSNSGCMSAFFQLFDFHPFQFPLHEHSPCIKRNPALHPQETTSLKGLEAPRNSLESIEAAPLSSIFEEEEGKIKIPMGIQIKTSGGDTRPKAERAKTSKSSSSADIDLFSECSSSPGTRTPTLLARLMGLDLLPESSSPSLSSIHGDPTPLMRKSQVLHNRAQNLRCQTRPKSHNNVGGTRSMPETPRMSLARHSDVDPRFSLQFNKENINAGEELFARGSPAGRRDAMLKHDEERSPGGYARQIVKQVKESVSRRTGIDITNTIRNRENRGDEIQIPISKSKKSPRLGVDENSPGKNLTPPSCSPRLRLLEPRIKTTTASVGIDQTPCLQHLKHPPPSPLSTSVDQTRPMKALPKPKSRPPENKQKEVHKRIQKCEKAAFGSRLKKPPQALEAQMRNKQEEAFKVRSSSNSSDRSCKRTPLSNELIINTKTLVPFKKDPSPPSTTSSAQQSMYTQEAKYESDERGDHRDCKPKPKTTMGVASDERAERHYITELLQCSRMDMETSIFEQSRFSSHHPLDPSVFDHLECQLARTCRVSTMTIVSNDPSLNHRCNRKLVFKLVDEVLEGIWKSRMNSRGSQVVVHCQELNGHELVDALCNRIRSFPLANCKVLEDIDALIERDLSHSDGGPPEEYEKEGEPIVAEIEKDIMDSLVRETVTMVFERTLCCSVRRRR